MLSKSLVVATAICCGMACVPARAATVTNVFTENFDDATLEAGLTNENGATIAGGIADLDGVDQGFSFSNAGFTGYATNWIMEAQLVDGDTAANLDTLFNFNGTLFLRRHDGTHAPWEVGLGGTELATGLTAPADGDHVGLVFTDGAPDTLSYYLNGSLQGTANITSAVDNFALMGFGLRLDTGTPSGSRGFDGSLDAIAFSTFTGTFGGGGEFELFTPNSAPEPSTLVIAVLGLIGLCFTRRRRK